MYIAKGLFLVQAITSRNWAATPKMRGSSVHARSRDQSTLRVCVRWCPMYVGTSVCVAMPQRMTWWGSNRAGDRERENVLKWLLLFLSLFEMGT